ncbi:MAG: hypothetical protein HY796_12205 [Elusimicrobia bacterium]|nr:hypothetical protein [Elusimicrobiota bacterium]
MNYPPQKLPHDTPPPDPGSKGSVSGPAKQPKIRNAGLKKQETLPAETHIQNLQLKISHVKNWLENENEKLNIWLQARTTPQTPDSAGTAPDDAPLEEPARQKLPDNSKLIGAVNDTGDRSAPSLPLQAEPGNPTAARLLRLRLAMTTWVVDNKVQLTIVTLAFLGILAGFLVLRWPFGSPANPGTISPPVIIRKQKAPDLPASPANHQVGLVYYGNRWLSVDWMDGRIFELNATTGLKLLQAFPNSFTTGLSAGNNCLWSTDAFNRRCYKHDPKTFAILASFPAPGPSPSAVYWDGSSLWLADKETRRAYKYLNIQGSATALIHYPLLEAEPVGLWRSDDLLWVLDRSGKSVRRYRVDKELIPVDILQLSNWLPEKTRPTGMALTGSEIWILTENPCLLYRHNLAMIAWSKIRTPEK